MGSAFLINHAGMVLKSIAITHAPTKTKYSNRSGSNFNTAGMEVTATYMNGIKKVITGYTYSPTNWANVSDSNVGTKNVTISYTEGGITKTATQQITLIKATVHYNFTAVSGWTDAGGGTQLTSAVSIDSDYKRASEIKVYWKLTQSGSTGTHIIYNDTGNYKIHFVENPGGSTKSVLVGDSPFNGWGNQGEASDYVHGRFADGTTYITTDLNRDITAAALRFTNGPSVKFYGTLEGAFNITTAY